jgi:hypothetical protein
MTGWPQKYALFIGQAVGLACALWLCVSLAGSGASYASPVSPHEKEEQESRPAAQPYTHVLYYPTAFGTRPCDPPLPGTASIAGQATVHGRPAPPGVPFRLSYVFWEARPVSMMTVTTGINGQFCFPSIPVLPYCHGYWYEVMFQYAEGVGPGDEYRSWWLREVPLCEAGLVYHLTAEIGRPLPSQAYFPLAALDAPVPAQEPPASLTADSYWLSAGECTNLRWSTHNAEQVYLEDKPVGLNGSTRTCPAQTTTFTLKAVLIRSGCPLDCPVEYATFTTVYVGPGADRGSSP